MHEVIRANSAASLCWQIESSTSILSGSLHELRISDARSSQESLCTMRKLRQSSQTIKGSRKPFPLQNLLGTLQGIVIGTGRTRIRRTSFRKAHYEVSDCSECLRLFRVLFPYNCQHIAKAFGVAALMRYLLLTPSLDL